MTACTFKSSDPRQPQRQAAARAETHEADRLTLADCADFVGQRIEIPRVAHGRRGHLNRAITEGAQLVRGELRMERSGLASAYPLPLKMKTKVGSNRDSNSSIDGWKRLMVSCLRLAHVPWPLIRKDSAPWSVRSLVWESNIDKVSFDRQDSYKEVNNPGTCLDRQKPGERSAIPELCRYTWSCLIMPRRPISVIPSSILGPGPACRKSCSPPRGPVRILGRFPSVPRLLPVRTSWARALSCVSLSSRAASGRRSIRRGSPARAPG